MVEKLNEAKNIRQSDGIYRKTEKTKVLFLRLDILRFIKKMKPIIKFKN